MTTFQAIVYGLVHGFTQFLPVSRTAHEMFIPYLLGWNPPAEAVSGGLSLGALLAVFIYFRHDWASIISCFAQVIIFRKRPMTLDERMPIFLLITTLPLTGAWYYVQGRFNIAGLDALKIAALTAAFGLPLWMGDYFSRKTKGMFDWNWKDAFVVGLTQITALIPGSDQLSAILFGALMRNYNRESASKYAFFAITPILLASTITQLHDLSFHAASPATGTTWLSFYLGTLISFLAGLLAIGGFMGQIQQKSLTQYVVYRWTLAGIMVATYWFRNR
jgi:undecaprenyl-diphosphatase